MGKDPMIGQCKKSRLENWDGRKHSTRREEPMLQRLTQRLVLAKLGVAWLTTVAVTVLAVLWGSPSQTPATWSRGVAIFLIFTLLAGSLVLYVARFQAGLAQSLPMIASVGVLIFATVFSGLHLHQAPWHAVVLPAVPVMPSCASAFLINCDSAVSSACLCLAFSFGSGC